MTKKSKSSSSRKRGNRSRKNRSSAVNGVVQPARQLKQWPVSSNPVFRITRSLRRKMAVDATNIDGLGAQTIQINFSPGATNWRLAGTSIYNDALPQSTEFTALFDQYRIISVIVRCDLSMNFSNSGSTPIVYPQLYYAVDYDDYTDATLTDLLQYPQVQLHNFQTNGYTPLMLKFSPKPLRDIAGSGIATGYGPMSVAPWIRTADFSVPHYGIKFALDWFGYAVASYQNLTWTVSYELEFTNPK